MIRLILFGYEVQAVVLSVSRVASWVCTVVSSDLLSLTYWTMACSAYGLFSIWPA